MLPIIYIYILCVEKDLSLQHEFKFILIYIFTYQLLWCLEIDRFTVEYV